MLTIKFYRTTTPYEMNQRLTTDLVSHVGCWSCESGRYVLSLPHTARTVTQNVQAQLDAVISSLETLLRATDTDFHRPTIDALRSIRGNMV